MHRLRHPAQPIIFGIVYGDTVASFPKAIFALAAAIVATALLATALLRPDTMLRPPRAARARADPPRGRSRKSKDIRQPSFGSAVVYVREAPLGDAGEDGDGDLAVADGASYASAGASGYGSVGATPASGPSSGF